jgi:hypothetical protein
VESLYLWDSLRLCAVLMLVEFYRAQSVDFKRLNVSTTEYIRAGAQETAKRA